MMKKTFFVLIAMALMLSGCFFPVRATRVIGSGDVITETRRVANFSAVELNGVGTLKIEQGETNRWRSQPRRI
jgi:outer membrane lipopolysaccharide assembly protein LptE/RlpB